MFSFHQTLASSNCSHPLLSVFSSTCIPVLCNGHWLNQCNQQLLAKASLLATSRAHCRPTATNRKQSCSPSRVELNWISHASVVIPLMSQYLIKRGNSVRGNADGSQSVDSASSAEFQVSSVPSSQQRAIVSDEFFHGFWFVGARKSIFHLPSQEAFGANGSVIKY